jgi:hypothetical protein
MRAIDTRYAGRLFRSRLEARYAVLFDALGIKWDYEPEGFVLDDGSRYLPDFWLHSPTSPGEGFWVEIKPIAPTPAELEKLRLLCVGSKAHGSLFFGPPDRLAGSYSCWWMTGKVKEDPSMDVSLALVQATPMVGTMRRSFDAASELALSRRFEFGVSKRGVQA